MNKVISVEIAKQVFWIDEDAYQNLQEYFANIKKQLAHDECADEIYQDIELRVAELLFGFNPSNKQAITLAQLETVIEQVGFIELGENTELDSASSISGTNHQKKSFLDPSNKIIAGVCSGLSIRFKVPALVLRLLFIALIMLFGLGAVLYIVFWISLETNNSRYTALAAEGKARTAHEIAKAEVPKEPAVMTLQRILFLPFSIVGTLISVVINHFHRRKSSYAWGMKNLFAVSLFLIGLTVFMGMLEFNANHVFHSFFAWVVGFAVTYLVVLTLVIYFKEFYSSKPRTKVDVKLKLGAILPVTIIAYTTYYLHTSQNEHVSEIVAQEYDLQSESLQIEFRSESHSSDLEKSQPHDRVRFSLRTSPNKTDKVKVELTYFARGKDLQNARDNIDAIAYEYEFSNDVLTLDTSWMLKTDYYKRGQWLYVTVTLPSNVVIDSNRAFALHEQSEQIEYVLAYHHSDTHFEYFASESYLHDWSKDFPNKLSENELKILQATFCDEFFIGESWGCESNIYRDLESNYRFDKAFTQDIETIDAIRVYLQPNRSLFVSHLDKIHELQSRISVQYKVKSDFEKYIEHLQRIKAQHVEYIVMNGN